jgi:predicted flap endonuclease-1-like 5' DNA nuclease
MSTLTKVLCRLWRCAEPSQDRDQTEESGNSSRDDLTAIRGIGIATQDRLYRAGIKSFSRLAQSSPEKVREILGTSARGAKVETWVKEAAGLAKAK